MKRNWFIIVALLLANLGFSQAPESFKYQTIVRNNSGDPLQNKNISVRINIIQGSPGSSVYSETHKLITDQTGLITLLIGDGTIVSGNFSNINWGNGNFFLKTELDTSGGINYKLVGLNQLLSVPYALYAKKTGSGTQTLSINDHDLTISNGNTVSLPKLFKDADMDSLNEIQTISKTGNTITLSNGGGSITDEVNDADADPFNEIQSISKEGDSITLSNGGGRITDETIDADADSQNELQAISITNDTLYLSNGNFVYLGSFMDNTDQQTLSINKDSITISNGNTVVINDDINDADHDSTNELQTLSYKDDTLSISNGNQIYFSGLSQGLCVPLTTTIPPSGFAFSGDSYKIYSSDTTWQTKTSMKYPRCDIGTYVIDGKIYVVGGRYVKGVYSAACEVYDPLTNTWTTKDSMNSASPGIVGTVFDEKIYIIGGAGNTQALDRNEVYDPITNTWTIKTSLPVALLHHIVEEVNGLIYVIGGHTSSGVVQTTNYVYDPVSDSWSTKTSLPSKTYGAASTVKDGKIYMFGGSSGSNYLSTSRVYDPATDKWSVLANMPDARRYASATVFNDKICVFGGSNYTSTGLVRYNTIFAYDISSNTWSQTFTMPDELSQLGVTVLNNLYIIGGYNGKSTNTVYKYSNEKTYYMHCKQ